MKVEQIFGAVALLALLAVAAFAMTGGRAGSATAAPAVAAGGLTLVGEAGADTCTCYEQGFATGEAKPDIQSVAYEAGYGACRDYAGQHGGSAWSWGYANGIEGKASKRSCRAYQAMVRG